MTLNADFKVKFAVFRFVSWMRGLIVSRTCLYVVRALLPETHNWTMDEVYIGTISHIDNTHESRQATERSNHVIEKK